MSERVRLVRGEDAACPISTRGGGGGARALTPRSRCGAGGYRIPLFGDPPAPAWRVDDPAAAAAFRRGATEDETMLEVARASRAAIPDPTAVLYPPEGPGPPGPDAPETLLAFAAREEENVARSHGRAGSLADAEALYRQATPRAHCPLVRRAVPRCFVQHAACQISTG